MISTDRFEGIDEQKRHVERRKSERSVQNIKGGGERERQQSKKQAGITKPLRGNLLCVMSPDVRFLPREHSGKTVNKVQLNFHGYKCATAGLNPSKHGCECGSHRYL